MSSQGTKKETIIAECDGSDYQHGEKYEQNFDHDHYSSVIFTTKVFKGKVKITIEELE